MLDLNESHKADDFEFKRSPEKFGMTCDHKHLFMSEHGQAGNICDQFVFRAKLLQ